MKKFNLISKRLMDIFGSLAGIVISSPFLIIIGFLIKTSSKGPLLFKQERLGKNGKRFKVLKFRTMVVNAENIGSGLFVKTEEDDRITNVGKFLRGTSLDELPQLWNVVVGDMSLVGPRPPVPHHPYKYEKYDDFQKQRFNMKPGITGLTQVEVRNSVSWEERIPMDVEYVKNFNIWLDIKIIMKTIKKMFARESIYLESEKK